VTIKTLVKLCLVIRNAIVGTVIPVSHFEILTRCIVRIFYIILLVVYMRRHYIHTDIHTYVHTYIHTYNSYYQLPAQVFSRSVPTMFRDRNSDSDRIYPRLKTIPSNFISSQKKAVKKCNASVAVPASSAKLYIRCPCIISLLMRLSREASFMLRLRPIR